MLPLNRIIMLVGKYAKECRTQLPILDLICLACAENLAEHLGKPQPPTTCETASSGASTGARNGLINFIREDRLQIARAATETQEEIMGCLRIHRVSILVLPARFINSIHELRCFPEKMFLASALQRNTFFRGGANRFDHANHHFSLIIHKLLPSFFYSMILPLGLLVGIVGKRMRSE